MSAIVLGELLHTLAHKEGNEKMTNQESEFFLQLRSQAKKSSLIGGSIATGLTLIATWKLNSFSRLALTGGAGLLTGFWKLHNSLDAYVDRILGMDGSRMQHELKKIILERYGNDPEKMKLFSKHFYCEEVFSDLTPGHTIPVYRPRNLYVDDNTTSDDITSQEFVKKGVYHQERNDDVNVQLKSRSAASQQVSMNSRLKAFGYGDPLDVLFGDSSAIEELSHPDESGKLAKAKSHSQRKARRKHRARRRHQATAQLQGA